MQLVRALGLTLAVLVGMLAATPVVAGDSGTAKPVHVERGVPHLH